MMTLEAGSPSVTDQIGTRLAGALRTGDFIALTGQMGAGKSHLARAVIRALLDDPDAEVPSPTYTLINVYEHPISEIWHADLYRLSGPDDLLELGLEEGTDHAIALVEWAERWPDPPARRLEIEIIPEGGDRRMLTISAHGDWRAVMQALS
ncbi:MAG: tRNA (adenosine(37)-N6)-threonylcarbamoyltransferase complex ATPase subunit type 1 TsaE [Pseudomonadota bacterium]